MLGKHPAQNQLGDEPRPHKAIHTKQNPTNHSFATKREIPKGDGLPTKFFQKITPFTTPTFLKLSKVFWNKATCPETFATEK
jgi:hypothetical protein